MDESSDFTPEEELAQAWFFAIEELASTALTGEHTSDRIKASEVILQYCISLGQSINEPYMPKSRPKRGSGEDSDD